VVEAGGVELKRYIENRQFTDFADLPLPSFQSLLAVLDQFGSVANPSGTAQEMRYSAGKVLNLYQQKMRTLGWTPRQDLLTLVGTMRYKGCPACARGSRKGLFSLVCLPQIP
jgi:hypothetical protein